MSLTSIRRSPAGTASVWLDDATAPEASIRSDRKFTPDVPDKLEKDNTLRLTVPPNSFGMPLHDSQAERLACSTRSTASLPSNSVRRMSATAPSWRMRKARASTMSSAAVGRGTPAQTSLFVSTAWRSNAMVTNSAESNALERAMDSVSWETSAEAKASARGISGDPSDRPGDGSPTLRPVAPSVVRS